MSARTFTVDECAALRGEPIREPKGPECESCGKPATRSIVTDWHCGMALHACDSCALCTCGACILPAGEQLTVEDDDLHSQSRCVVEGVKS